MNRSGQILIGALSMLLALVQSVAAQSGAVNLTSKHSVAETVERLEAAIKAGDGYAVFAKIDYAAIAATRGGKARPGTLVLFGRGNAVPALLNASPTLGLDLPLKIYIWQADDGSVSLSFNTAEFLINRHAVSHGSDLLRRITETTALFAKKAS